MITKVAGSEILSMAGTIIAGIFANPSNGHVIADTYSRQQIIQQVLNEIQQTLITSGIRIEEEQREQIN